MTRRTLDIFICIMDKNNFSNNFNSKEIKHVKLFYQSLDNLRLYSETQRVE